MAEIRGAIAAADAFDFVLSPDSVASEVCRAELDDAAAATSRTLIDEQPDLAILLALEGQREASTNESESALVAAASRQPELVTYLRGHTDAVNTLAMTPNGQRLYSASTDGTIREWDASEPGRGSLLADLEDPPTDVALSPAGSFLVVSGFRGVTFFDVTTGEQLARFETGGPDLLMSVAVAPDQGALAAGGDRDRPYVWDLTTGEVIEMISDGAGGPINAIAFDSTGNRLATGGPGSLSMWDTDAGAEMWEIAKTSADPVSFVSDVAFTEDDDFVVAAGSLNSVVTVEVLELDTAIAASGRVVAWPTAEGHVTVWERDSDAVRSLEHPSSVTGVCSAAIDPTESIIAAGQAGDGYFSGTSPPANRWANRSRRETRGSSPWSSPMTARCLPQGTPSASPDSRPLDVVRSFMQGLRGS